MEAISEDQFKVNYLRQRIAKLTVDYEDALVRSAIQSQVLLQERDELKSQVESLSNELAVMKQDQDRMASKN